MLFVTDARWDFTAYHVITVGEPHISVRCLCIVNERVWCGYRNQVFVIEPESLDIEVVMSNCDIRSLNNCVIVLLRSLTYEVLITNRCSKILRCVSATLVTMMTKSAITNNGIHLETAFTVSKSATLAERV